MDSCKEPKRLLDLEYSCDEELSQKETDLVEAKRQRKASVESSGDDFEEFVAVMERIQYMKSNQNLRNSDIREEIFMEGVLDTKVIKTQPPRMPSFQWEDFCVGKYTVPAQRDICSVSTKDNPGSYEEKGKQSFQPANYLKTVSSSIAHEKCPAESFDLNVEATSNV